MKKFRFLLILLYTFIGISFSQAAKMDSVYLKNGNIITGEISSLTMGILKYDTDDMGTLNIEWDKIESLKSKENFFIKMDYGSIFYGSLDVSAVGGMDMVLIGTDTVLVDHMGIVMIQQRKNGFWENLDGYASVGFNMTQANKDIQLTGDLDMTYKGDNHYTDLSSSIILKRREGDSGSRKETYSLNHYISLPSKLFYGGALSFEQNTELNLKLRSKVTAFGGKHFILTNSSQLMGVLGAVANNEVAISDNISMYNTEIQVGFSFKTYRYDNPELDISSSIYLYQGINHFERQRVDFQTKIRWEVFEDFFLSLSVYDNFDSKALATQDMQNDYGIVSSIGYKF